MVIRLFGVEMHDVLIVFILQGTNLPLDSEWRCEDGFSTMPNRPMADMVED